MAKNSITDYDNIAANNTDIQSVDIDEGCAPSGINNAIRELMADLADVNDGTVPLASPDINGGTIDGVTIGGTTAGAGTFTTGTFSGNLTVDTNTLFVDSANNRVGIGTILPDTALHIDNPDNGAITAILDTDNTAVKLVFRNTTETGNNIQIGADGSNLVAVTGAAERMRIDSSGNVGIGTSSPDAKMNIEQSGAGNFDSIILSRTTGNVGDVQSIVWQQNDLSNLKAASISGEVTGASAGALVFNTATGGTLTERALLDSSGNLHVDGNVIAYSTTISDKRLKKDIQPIENALWKVNQINGCTFTYLKDDRKSAGLIAQDLEKVLPSAVIEDQAVFHGEEGETYKTVQYDQVIGLLVEAIKELNAKVEGLENGITS
jgi:hypothetical protein